MHYPTKCCTLGRPEVQLFFHPKVQHYASQEKFINNLVLGYVSFDLMSPINRASLNLLEPLKQNT